MKTATFGMIILEYQQSSLVRPGQPSVYNILVGGAGHDTLDGGPGIDILIEGGSVRVGKSLRTANRKSHGMIDWHASYGELFAAGHRVGGGSYLSSPSWVRQFVLNLGGGDKDPNSDIRVTIHGWTDPQHSGLGSRKKGSVA